jgi:peptidoglycan L-alanyl-D-glutamate endopeptidase CwlK
MSVLAINITPGESTHVGSTSSSRSKRENDSPNAASTNAFAATLAHAMHAPASAPAESKPRDANSDLDADPDSSSSGRVSASGAATHKGKPAFAAAAEARAAVAATPVDTANSDTDALNPDFRTKLTRVINRMHDEFGKDVQLVEGFRTQSRQDFLYDQGRTRPGDVVTWTKSSKHTLGLAADVMIDGSYTDAAGFRQLAQVAAQEGLRTLGAKDPGHIELPTRGGAAAWGASAETVNIDDNVSRAIGIALDPGSSDATSDDSGTFGRFNGLLSRAGRGGSATGAPPIQMPIMSGGGMGSGGMSQRSFGDAQKDSTRSDESAKVANVASVASVANVASVAQVAQVAHLAGVGQPQAAIMSAPVMVPVTAGAGSDAADKVGRILDARDSAPVQPLSHVTLNIDNPNGASDQVTIQLRSGAVDTAISLGDPNRADRMSLRVGELQHALEQHGLNATAINVASSANSSGAGWSPRPGSDQSAQNGRPSLNYRDNRQDADGTRHRSRREQQGGEK